MGQALKELGWPEKIILFQTKIFWGGKGPNDRGLSYKHIIEGVNGALKRLQLDYVDFVFATAGPGYAIEETVFAFNQVIREGKAFYCGYLGMVRSRDHAGGRFCPAEWTASAFHGTAAIHLFHRQRFWGGVRAAYKELGNGTTTGVLSTVAC